MNSPTTKTGTAPKAENPGSKRDTYRQLLEKIQSLHVMLKPPDPEPLTLEWGLMEDIGQLTIRLGFLHPPLERAVFSSSEQLRAGTTAPDEWSRWSRIWFKVITEPTIFVVLVLNSPCRRLSFLGHEQELQRPLRQWTLETHRFEVQQVLARECHTHLHPTSLEPGWLRFPKVLVPNDGPDAWISVESGFCPLFPERRQFLDQFLQKWESVLSAQIESLDKPTEIFEFVAIGNRESGPWRIRFDNEQGQVDGEPAARLRRLVVEAQFFKGIEAIELMHGTPDGLTAERSDDHFLDQQGYEEYFARIRELESQAQARPLNPKEIEELESLRNDCASYIKHRKRRGTNSKATHAVRTGFSRLYKELKERGMPKAASHFEHFVSVEGGEFRYKHGKEWITHPL